MDSVNEVVKKQVNSDLSIIPGGLTGHIQSADMCWNKPFKASYKDLYAEWTANGQKTYTAVRPPAKLLCLEWVKKAWESVSTEVVKKSFLSCGISMKIDGGEDGQIHCIKKGGIAEAAKDEITRSTAKMLSPQQVEGSEDDQGDPFADLERN